MDSYSIYIIHNHFFGFKIFIRYLYQVYGLKNVRRTGFIILSIGVATLLFTFLYAFQLLIGFGGIAGDDDLISLFGVALAPLMSYAIRALYLGIMGWIGSILTRRGVQIVTSIPKEEKVEVPAEDQNIKDFNEIDIKDLNFKEDEKS